MLLVCTNSQNEKRGTRMGKMSKAKGGRGEREFAELCRQHGYDAHRGQQFQGGIDSPDVTGLPGVHIEVKRVERLNVDDAMRQSIRDSEGKAIPIVAHRKNKQKWLVTMLAEDWFEFYRAWEQKNSFTESVFYQFIGMPENVFIRNTVMEQWHSMQQECDNCSFSSENHSI